MSATTTTSDIIHSNDKFCGPNLAGDKYSTNKISCELGEIYYQTEVDKDGKNTGVASNGNSNGLFISNDKLQELINSGQISKYSWLMQLVLKNRVSFLEPAKAGFKKDSSGHNPSTYYQNGIFVPLTSGSSNKDNNKIVFKLPYGDNLKLTLHFNNSNIDTPYDPKDISESVIECQNKENQNCFGVKEEYRDADKSNHSGAFFVLNDGKDVTSQVPMVVKDLAVDNEKIKGKAVMCLPTDFDKNTDVKDLWKDDKQKVISFFMVPDENGNLRLKMHEKSLSQQIVYDWAKSHFTPTANPNEFFKIDDNDKDKCTIKGKFNGENIEIVYTRKTMILTVNTPPALNAQSKIDFQNLVDDLNKIFKFEAANVASGNSKLCDLLNQSGTAVDIGKENTGTTKDKTAILNKNGKNLVLDNVCGLNYDDAKVHSYIDGTPDYKEVRLYKDISNNKTYYCEYDPVSKKITNEPKELGDKTILHCKLGEPGAYVVKKNNDKWVIVSTKKKIDNGANKKNDIHGILKDTDVENLLKGVKQEYDNGQIDKIFKQDGGTPSLAENVLQKLGDKFDIQTESNGVVKPICTYIPPAAAGQPGKFELKNGEVKQLDDVNAVQEGLKKKEEEAIQADIENDNTKVLSGGELYDFCASQIGATKPQQQNADQVEEEDPIKAKAQEYLRNINVFMPGASFEPHANKHMEKKMKNINNANGFNVKFRKHVNKHMEKKMKKINNLSGFTKAGNGTSVG